MNFTSKVTTTTINPDRNTDHDLKFDKDEDFYIAKVSWEHMGEDSLKVELSIPDFTVSLSVNDSTGMFHSLKSTVALNAQVVSTENIEYEVIGEELRIYMPKKNFIFNKEKQTVTVPKRVK